MLESVPARSLVLPQFVENSEGPKGVTDELKLLFCGIEPARKRDKRVEVALVEFDRPSPFGSLLAVKPAWKGLVEGVGRDTLGKYDPEAPEPCEAAPLAAEFGENLEGSVPARILLPDEGGARVSVPGDSKSGKLSSLGDSGIVSRRGVELPLVGGPHGCAPNPSCAWISRALGVFIRIVYKIVDGGSFLTYRLGKSLLLYSFEGEAAPMRWPPAALADGVLLPGVPSGYRTAALEGGSMGEVAAVEEPDRGCGAPSCGR